MGKVADFGDAIGMDWAALGARLPPSGYRRFRNALDPIVGAVLLLIASALILTIAIAILLDSGGPIFFMQCRAGRFARPFMMVKFRTMSTLAPEFSLKVAPDDPHITRVGSFLRRSGLDELPNLWNVVRGDMALIGPRPEQFALLGYYMRWQHLRHLVKPGITGWWQIHHRDSQPMHLNVEKDVYYVCNQGPGLDMRIVLSTVTVPFQVLLSRERVADGRHTEQTLVPAELASTADGSHE